VIAAPARQRYRRFRVSVNFTVSSVRPNPLKILIFIVNLQIVRIRRVKMAGKVSVDFTIACDAAGSKDITS
jgi:hypothetical protein